MDNYLLLHPTHRVPDPDLDPTLKKKPDPAVKKTGSGSYLIKLTLNIFFRYKSQYNCYIIGEDLGRGADLCEPDPDPTSKKKISGSGSPGEKQDPQPCYSECYIVRKAAKKVIFF